MSTSEQSPEFSDGDDVTDELLIWGREITVGFAALDPAALRPWTQNSSQKPVGGGRVDLGGSSPPPRHQR